MRKDFIFNLIFNSDVDLMDILPEIIANFLSEYNNKESKNIEQGI